MRQKLLFTPLLLSLMAGCVVAPPPPPAPIAVAAVRPQEIYFYPARGQSPQQVDRDRYECHEWARKESHFDPSLPNSANVYAAAHMQDATPGRDTITGAVAGAAIGSVAANRPGQGAAIGAVAGAVVGAVNDAERNQAIDRANAAADQRAAQANDAQSSGYDRYKRALAACGAGRGYDVR